jgi:hypothetical protein
MARKYFLVEFEGDVIGPRESFSDLLERSDVGDVGDIVINSIESIDVDHITARDIVKVFGV